MKTPLLASLSAKVAAGIAGAALLTGGAGTVLTFQPASETSKVPTTADATQHDDSSDEVVTSTTDDEVADDGVTDDGELLESNTSDVDSNDADEADGASTTREHPDNFGAQVSEDARDGGVEGQEIAAAARARNEARRADRAATTADDDAPARGARGDERRGGKSNPSADADDDNNDNED